MENDSAASTVQCEKQKAHWSDDEMRALIKIWEDHLSDLRRAKRNMRVYVAIRECLLALGIDKTVKEVKSKIENLGNRYRMLSRKTAGQGAITWRFYKEIARFLGNLPINDSSLVDETAVCGDGATVEILIDSMQYNQSSPGDSNGNDADTFEMPPAPYESECEAAALSVPSPLASSAEDHRAPPPGRQAAKPSCNATQKTLLSQLINTNSQLSAELGESRRQEMELRKMELEILRESLGNEKCLTEALLKYLQK